MMKIPHFLCLFFVFLFSFGPCHRALGQESNYKFEIREINHDDYFYAIDKRVTPQLVSKKLVSSSNSEYSDDSNEELVDVGPKGEFEVSFRWLLGDQSTMADKKAFLKYTHLLDEKEESDAAVQNLLREMGEWMQKRHDFDSDRLIKLTGDHLDSFRTHLQVHKAEAEFDSKCHQHSLLERINEFFDENMAILHNLAPEKVESEKKSLDPQALKILYNQLATTYQTRMKEDIDFFTQTKITKGLFPRWAPGKGELAKMPNEKAYRAIYELLTDPKLVVPLLHQLVLEVQMMKARFPNLGEQEKGSRSPALDMALKLWEGRTGFNQAKVIFTENVNNKTFQDSLINKRPIVDHGAGPGHGIDSHRIQWNLISRAIVAHPESFFEKEQLRGKTPREVQLLISELYAGAGKFQNCSSRKTEGCLDWGGARESFTTRLSLWDQMLDGFGPTGFGSPSIYPGKVKKRFPELGNL